MDLRPHDRLALDLAGEAIDRVAPGQLGVPTPCPPWTMADLLIHMISQNKRFAAAARGTDPDEASPLDGGELGDDPAAAYAASVVDVTDAFAAPDIAGRRMVLPELPGPMPGPAAIGFHFTDFLVHGWDVARSAGLPFAPEEGLTAVALGLAARIPDEARGPGAAFGPAVTVGPGADAFDRLLGLAGRDPRWNAPGTPRA